MYCKVVPCLTWVEEIIAVERDEESRQIRAFVLDQDGNQNNQQYKDDIRRLKMKYVVIDQKYSRQQLDL